MRGVDASCLVEILIGAADAEPVRERLALDQEHAAPHVIDVEMFGAIRRERRLGRIDQAASGCSRRSTSVGHGRDSAAQAVGTSVVSC